jgi:hypothetical protein
MALISKQIVRHIEGELRSYPQKIRMVKEQRDEIILGSHYPDVSVSGGKLSNTTQSKGMRLAQLETGWPELIQYALEMIPHEQHLLIKYRYFEGKSREVVADKLHVSLRHYYAWREDLIFTLVLMATKKGMINPFD